MAREGDIALCRKGIVGVITRVKASPVAGIMHYGYCKDDPSQNWQSKHPKVIGNIHDLSKDESTEAGEGKASG